jgi:OFA family oxalate/formate antiporter-like MFS transporter
MNAPYPDAQRWPIALAGAALQVCLGTVYAWSYFQTPIRDALGWSNEAVTGVFSMAICCLGLAAAWGGWQLKREKLSPRLLAVTGGVLFGLGHFVAAAALAWNQWSLLLLGYGVIGGTGLGLGYVVPVATAAKWFPDKKGFITGLVVMGFGLGALLMSKVLAPLALQVFHGNIAAAFAAMGGVFIVIAPLAGMMMKNPPVVPEISPASFSPPAPIAWDRFALLWLLFFCNIFAGISIISFQSPLLQDLLARTRPGISAPDLAAAGATLIACSALCNGLGRFVWGAVSDRIGQARAFSLMFAAQIAAFLLLPRLTSPLLFGGLVCAILLCYGGGFGVAPSFVHQLFGEKSMALLYGLALTAWSAAGVAGPKFLAWLRDHHPPEQAGSIAFAVSAMLMTLGLLLSLLPALRTRHSDPA